MRDERTSVHTESIVAASGSWRYAGSAASEHAGLQQPIALLRELTHGAAGGSIAAEPQQDVALLLSLVSPLARERQDTTATTGRGFSRRGFIPHSASLFPIACRLSGAMK